MNRAAEGSCPCEPSLYGGDGVTTFALPDLRGVAPNGLTLLDLRRGDLPVAVLMERPIEDDRPCSGPSSSTDRT